MTFVLNQITLQFLLRTSLVISVLGFIIRTVVFNRSKLWQKYEVPVLQWLIKNPLTYRILAFCNNATFRFFTPKYQYITTTVIILSSFCFGVGLPLRLFILYGYVVPYQETMFLILAINGLFRSVIGLGMILQTGGLWRQILEQMGKSAARNSARVSTAMQNSPSGSNGNSENSGNNENDHENSRNSKSDEPNNNAYIKWGTVFGGVAATGTIIGLGFTFYDRSVNFQKEIIASNNRSVEASNRAIEASNRATEASNRSAEASNRAADSNMYVAESISRLAKEIAAAKRDKPLEKD